MLWCVNWFFASVRKTFENCSVYPYIVGIFFCVSLYLWLLNLGRILPLWKPLLPCTWFNACAHVYLLTMPCLAEWLVGYIEALFLSFLDITVHWLMADNWTTVLPRHTHTHPFNGPFPGLPGLAGTRKVKPIWILLKQETVSGSGISWAICKSATRSRQITTPASHHSVFYRPDALPAAQPTASKHLDLEH